MLILIFIFLRQKLLAILLIPIRYFSELVFLILIWFFLEFWRLWTLNFIRVLSWYFNFLKVIEFILFVTNYLVRRRLLILSAGVNLTFDGKTFLSLEELFRLIFQSFFIDIAWRQHSYFFEGFHHASITTFNLRLALMLLNWSSSNYNLIWKGWSGDQLCYFWISHRFRNLDTWLLWREHKIFVCRIIVDILQCLTLYLRNFLFISKIIHFLFGSLWY